MACVVACSARLRATNPRDCFARSSSSPSPRPRAPRAEPNSVYAERRRQDRRRGGRADHSLELHGPRRIRSTYIFHQEDGFYYLTAKRRRRRPDFPCRPQRTVPSNITGPARERCCSSRRGSRQGKMERRSNVPSDPGIQARTGFRCGRSFSGDAGDVERLRSCIHFVHDPAVRKRKTVATRTKRP